MTTKTDDINLPPLPPRDDVVIKAGDRAIGYGPVWNERSMLDYGAACARAAVEADRQGRIPSDDELKAWGQEEEFFLFCDPDEFLDIVKSALSRYSSSQPAPCDCADKSQCWEPCGSLGHDADNAKLSSQPVAVLERPRLRELVDVVWKDATESTEVPGTFEADQLIDKVFSDHQPAASAEPAGWREFIENIATPRSEPLNSVSAYRDNASRRSAMGELRRKAQELLHAAPVAAQAQPSGNAGELSDEREAFVAWLSGEFPRAWPAWMAERAWDNNHVAAMAWRVAQSTAQDREDAHDIEAAAKTLAECMDYPWEPMPEKGREAMRKHAKRVIDAARAAKERP